MGDRATPGTEPATKSAGGAASARRDRPWIFRTYAGHSSAQESNELYRRNLAKGQTGLSVAFDLPTQTGYDPDHPLARGEVGKVGVPIAHLGDMRALFDRIPLEQMNTSMTINATAPWLLALYVAAADEQGADRAELAGTTQNDIIKEYLSRGTYVFPPAPSLRLTRDVIAWTYGAMPKWNPMNVCSYHLQEAGATPVQELSFALATAIAILDEVKASGAIPPGDFPQAVGRISFFVNAGMRFITEICKMRAFAELWDEICLTRYGVEDERYRRFRYGVQVNSLGLTEQQPENNVYRILIEALAVVLSKNARARAVQLPAWNEALGLPRPFDQQWSLRVQQILAYETDLLEFEDIFDGSSVIGQRVEALKSEAREELARIEEMGGAVAAVESSYMKQALVASNAARLAAIEAGEQVVVGVNRFTESEPSPLATGEDGGILTVPEHVEADAIATLKAWRKARDEGAVAGAIAALKRASKRGHQHHGAVDRGGEGRRHHRRMGRGAARGVRRIPGPDRRRQGGACRRGRPCPGAGSGGERVGEARPTAEVPGRQARPRRPFPTAPSRSPCAHARRPRCRRGRRGRPASRRPRGPGPGPPRSAAGCRRRDRRRTSSPRCAS